jgi:hypothetical protein
MGIHWYARSRELIAISQALEDGDHRIFGPDASAADIDAANAECDVLFDRQDAARLALKQQSESVGVRVIRDWPESLRRHAAAYGTPREGQSFVDFVG